MTIPDLVTARIDLLTTISAAARQIRYAQISREIGGAHQEADRHLGRALDELEAAHARHSFEKQREAS